MRVLILVDGCIPYEHNDDASNGSHCTFLKNRNLC